MEIAIIIGSILLSAFFSGMEIAFVSANKLQIELAKGKDDLSSRLLSKLTNTSSKFITTMLVGNNIALVVYSYYMGMLLSQWFGFESLVIQTIISTLVILVTAEFLPKAIFSIYSYEMLKLLAIPAYFFYFIFHYISDFISYISNFILRKFFNLKEEEQKTAFSREELGNYITEKLADSSNEEEVDSEIMIFKNALEFHEVKAREVMVPRTEIAAVEMRETIIKLKELFIDSGYSKILVYKNSLDDIVGYVHAFELFKQPKTIRSIMLPVEIVPESMLINNVLNILTKKNKSVAIVIDEYGGTSGMITVEDIIEELFGEIEDEHDNNELAEIKLNDYEYQLSARHEIDYLNEEFDLQLPKEDSYETLGGLIVFRTGDIPEKGEKIVLDQFVFRILEVSASKIEAVHLLVQNTE